MKVNMHEAKTKLSQLAEMVWKGKKVVIAKAGRPYLDLLPHREDRKARTPGRLKGSIEVAADFDETPAHVIKAFSGE